jgi:hypothetical protein
MPDYQKGKIYRLTCLNTGLEYIGSTCDSLNRRLNNHSTKYNSWKQGKANNCGSFKIIEGGNYKIDLVEDYPCNNVEELHIRERYWYDLNTNPLCNRFLPYKYYTDLQKQRKIADAKRAKNPTRIANKAKSSALRYWLKKELTFYNLH